MTRYLFIIAIIVSGCLPFGHKGEFQARTGLEPGAAFDVVATDTYFAGEGEYSIVFRTTQEQIDTWLKNNPPWKNERWRTGQVPHQIGICCQFNFPERVAVSGSKESGQTYRGDKDLEQLLNDTTNYYVFREDCCNDERLRFHDGALLIIQPRTKMVYYSHWNY